MPYNSYTPQKPVQSSVSTIDLVRMSMVRNHAGYDTCEMRAPNLTTQNLLVQPKLQVGDEKSTLPISQSVPVERSISNANGSVLSE